MSQRLKRYLNDVLDGKNMNILEVSQDLCLQNRLQLMVKNLNITEQSFKSCMKNIASELLKDPIKKSYVLTLLLFSKELDSYHSMHSTSWYTRDKLIVILHDIFLEYGNRIYKKQRHYFWEYFLILLITSLICILLWLIKKIEHKENGIFFSGFN